MFHEEDVFYNDGRSEIKAWAGGERRDRYTSNLAEKQQSTKGGNHDKEKECVSRVNGARLGRLTGFYINGHGLGGKEIWSR